MSGVCFVHTPLGRLVSDGQLPEIHWRVAHEA